MLPMEPDLDRGNLGDVADAGRSTGGVDRIATGASSRISQEVSRSTTKTNKHAFASFHFDGCHLIISVLFNLTL